MIMKLLKINTPNILYLFILFVLSSIVINKGCTPFDVKFPYLIILLNIIQLVSVIILYRKTPLKLNMGFYSVYLIILFFLIWTFYNEHQRFNEIMVAFFKYIGRENHFNSFRNQLFFSILGILLISLYLFFKNNKYYKIIIISINILFIFIYINILNINFNADIDTIPVLNKSVQTILRFENPYELDFSNTQKPEFLHSTHGICVLVYWGINLFILTPFYYIFEDVRFALLFFTLLTYISMFLIEKKENKTTLYSPFIGLIFLLNPYSLNIILSSWTESIPIFFMFIYFYFLYKKNYLWSVLFLGLLVSTKQYFIFLIPICYIYYHSYNNILKSLYFCGLFFIAFIIFQIPFILDNPESYYYNTIKIARLYSPRWDSLSWTGYIFRYGIDFTGTFQLISLVFIFIIYYLQFNRKTSSITSIIFLHFSVMMSIFVYAKVAFGNYYFVCINILLYMLYFYFIEKKIYYK
jgi:hypothetical protein